MIKYIFFNGGRLEELVARVGGDLINLEEQVEQADVTFGAGAVIELASLVLKSLLLLSTKQQKGVLQPSSSLPDYSLLFSLQNCSAELSRFGEWCKMFQSWQLHFTA